MKPIIQPLKGTRDFYPEVMAARTWLYGLLREVAESFGYQEYDGPFLEPLALYAAKSGEELVKEQSFVFPDRGGDMITLRPELTPSLARMVAQRQRQLVYPLRWWSFGPFWRYERPQKGRTREFFQWNVDLLGIDSPEADAELVTVVATFFQKAGLSPAEVVILVNNRRLLDAELTAAGVLDEQKPSVLRWIDRRDKLSPADWEAYASEIGLRAEQVEMIKTMLADTELWRKSDELVRLFAAVQALGTADYVKYDPGVVRGLDYYTGTVFEAYEIRGDVRRAILGGGRYNNLLADVGGEPLPGVGFAMGDVVITLILEARGLIPPSANANPADVLVTVFDAGLQPASLALAASLRQAGLCVNCYPEPAKLPKQFKYADRLGIRVAAVIGPDEAANGQVTIKDLGQGTQQTVDQADAAAQIRKILSQ
ncbi:MAG TPA: histidine--tRNA ligase [Anaerolineales bacterium]|nr:histidine--tRNA ligase [Anaerolineales bacterium]